MTYSRQLPGSLSVAKSTALRPHPSSTVVHCGVPVPVLVMAAPLLHRLPRRAGLVGRRGRPQGAHASGSSFAGEAALDGAAGAVEVGRIGVEVEVPVRRQQRGLELERQLRANRCRRAARLCAWASWRGPLEGVHPLRAGTRRCGPGPDPGLAVELGHGGGEEASPWEHCRVRHRTGRRRTARAGAVMPEPDGRPGRSPHARNAAGPPRSWPAAGPPWSRSGRTTRSCSWPARSPAARCSGRPDRRPRRRRRRRAGSCLASGPQHCVACLGMNRIV